MQNPSDEIKAKLDIVEVIRDYIQLKAAGINFRALCPFHREKTPSFMVSPEKQIWHCFGCGKGGDIFTFIMEIEGISFVEAIRLLAQKAGVVLRRSDPKLASQRNRLLDLLDITAKFYQKILLASPKAEPIRSYLTKRGLNEETINTWQIGYSLPDWDSTVNFLKSKGFGENEIFLAGLSVKRQDSSRFYDRFRGRIMFPISDINGSIVGFSARVSPAFAEASTDAPPSPKATDGHSEALADKSVGKPGRETQEKLAKYINSPQTMIYDKSKILFGLDKARLSIKQQDAGILVEGQMDAITAHQHGFTNVVATSGTALTASQVALLKRYSTNLLLAFDMDRAGDLAAERGIAQAMQAEMNIKVIELSEGKDPDEAIRQNPDNWIKAVNNAKPMMQYLFDKTFVKFNPENIDGQRQALKILIPQLVKLNNKIERDFWLKKLCQITEVEENFLREELIKQEKRIKQENPSFKINPAEDEKLLSKQTREEMLSELLLALILKFPSHLEYVFSHLSPEQLFGEICQTIYKSLIIYYNKNRELDNAQSDLSGTVADDSQINQPLPVDVENQAEETIVVIKQDEWMSQGESAGINYNEFRGWLSENLSISINDKANINNRLDGSVCLNRLDKLVLLADKDFYDFSQEQAKGELINIVTALKKNYLIVRLKQITKLIAQTEGDNSAFVDESNKVKLKTLLEEFKALTEEIKEMES